LLLKRADVNAVGAPVAGDSGDMISLYNAIDVPNLPADTLWRMDLNVDGAVNILDVGTMITELFRTVPGDFDLDGDVDIVDSIVLTMNAGMTNATFLNGDANLNGVVDATDRGIWQMNFGYDRDLAPLGGGGSSTAVPEPAAVALAAIGLSLFGTLRRNDLRGNLET
jgi:alpha-amylase